MAKCPCVTAPESVCASPLIRLHGKPERWSKCIKYITISNPSSSIVYGRLYKKGCGHCYHWDCNIAMGMAWWDASDRMQRMQLWAYAHSNKMASCNEASNRIHRKCLVLVFEALVKWSQHHHAQYKMELIYIQFRMKGQGSLDWKIRV